MSAFLTGRSPGQTISVAAATESNDTILLTARDFARLERLASLELQPGDAARDALVAILERSTIVACDEIGDDVATLNARLRFRIEDRAEETRILVHPAHVAVIGLCLPVTTPIGLALLGRRTGAIVTVIRQGRRETARLTAIAHQPEAARRALAGIAAHR